MPAPGPIPTSHPNDDVRLPPDFIEGSNTLSAKKPAINIAGGPETCAINRLVENTRPCRSGATLLCHIDWLEMLIIGFMSMERKKIETQAVMTRAQVLLLE